MNLLKTTFNKVDSKLEHCFYSSPMLFIYDQNENEQKIVTNFKGIMESFET